MEPGRGVDLKGAAVPDAVTQGKQKAGIWDGNRVLHCAGSRACAVAGYHMGQAPASLLPLLQGRFRTYLRMHNASHPVLVSLAGVRFPSPSPRSPH